MTEVEPPQLSKEPRVLKLDMVNTTRKVVPPIGMNGKPKGLKLGDVENKTNIKQTRVNHRHTTPG